MSQNNGFRHFRNMNIHGEIHNKGAITVAFSAPKHVADLTSEDQVNIALAVCSRDDNFIHAIGRSNALNNMRLGGETAEDQKTAKFRATIPGDQFRDLLHTENLHDLRRDVKSGDLLGCLDQDASQSFINLIASARVRL